LFTADPVTGRRRRAAIDAVAGLGDKLVAGAVDPDHYAVEIASHEVVQRPPAGQASVLSDQEVLSLAEFGDRVDRHFNAPQDIEFALDQERRVWLVQSRPITTLYPLPQDATDTERGTRLSLARRSRFRAVRAIAGALMRAGVPHSALRVVRSPEVTRARYVREIEEFARIDLPEDATSEQRLDAFERLILTVTPRMFPRMI